MIAYLMLGQEKADNLKATYTVFEDVTDSVGLAPYIEWAAANGVVGGYGNGNFGPYDTLTEYAFGKMLLGAIGFDAAKAGYTGAGWQKNVYRDAVSKGIYDGTETYAACTRDTAARMVLATLETSYVVYGNKQIDGYVEINGKWYDVTGKLGVSSVAVAGVYDTELSVWQTYEGLTFNGDAFDVWGNPGDRWTYEEFDGFYEDDYVVSYTTQVSDCDVLVDLGYAVNSNKSATLKFIYNGDFAVGPKVADADSYYVYTADLTTKVFSHDDRHVICDDHFVGGQGVLTKVFKTSTNNYLVTEVATYLAKVDSVVKTHKSTVTNVTVGYRDLTGFGMGTNTLASRINEDDANHYYILGIATSAYAKGDYLLVTMNRLNQYADAAYKGTAAKDAQMEVVGHELATATLGKLTGYEKDVDAAPGVGLTYVSHETETDAFGFSVRYGLNNTKTTTYLGETLAFYYDNYGNVIGAVAPESISTYAVVDAIWSKHDRDLTVWADVVTLDAAMTKDASVVKFNGYKANELDENDDIQEKAVDNADAYAYYLYTYTVTDGDYTLTRLLDKATDKSTYYDVEITFDEGDDDLFYYGEFGSGVDYKAIQLTPKTEILMRDVNGNYTAAVGYAALKDLSAETVEVVFDTNGFAKVVFLNNVTFLDAYVTGYIIDADATSPVLLSDGKTYYQYNFYVDGEVSKIYLAADHDDVLVYYGLYEAQFNAVGGNLVVDDLKTDLYQGTYSASNGDAEGKYARTTFTKYASDMIMLANQGSEPKAHALDGITVYEVDMTRGGTALVKVEDTASYFAALDAGTTVDVVLNEKGTAVVAAYVIIAANNA